MVYLNLYIYIHMKYSWHTLFVLQHYRISFMFIVSFNLLFNVLNVTSHEDALLKRLLIMNI